MLKKTQALALHFIYLFIALTALTSCKNKDQVSEAQGIFEADEVMIISPVDGEIKQLNVHEGDNVKQGEILAKIDTVVVALQKDYVEAEQKNARTNGVVSAAVQTEVLNVQIDALAKEQARIQRLVEKGVLAQRQLDEINAKLDAAKAQKAAALQQVSKQNNGSIGTANALNAQIALANEAITRSTITAPSDGTVLNLYVNKGELTGKGRPLMKIANLDTMTLRIYLTAAQLESIKLGQPVSVYSDMGGNNKHRYEGKITWISSEAEFTPKNIQTSDMRSSLIYAAKVRVANDGFLKIGQYGKAEIDLHNDTNK